MGSSLLPTAKTLAELAIAVGVFVGSHIEPASLSIDLPGCEYIFLVIYVGLHFIQAHLQVAGHESFDR